MKTMKALATGAVLLTSVMTLQGCLIVADGYSDDGEYSASDYRKLEEKNRRMIAALDNQVTLDYVRNTMGTPEFADRVTVDGERYDVLYYRTQRVESDGNTTRDECTPLVFENGKLVGTGQLALKRIPQHD
ncbi:DUF3192 domain-containing protein [Pseudidiomarina insulisalsae]|uniref:DUF3192 domain-containing protein n=1 Tax=Pseudidiomarina insulisalsae TaxID=575789 RepID=A0A432YCQ1_9GAMM|nr:DUF3192 domain-containing protein [Pseudidiomarina insulisalsae]RUO58713.1 hypothetical protein CWI71_09825 [Pseudidiomarina insulisalsae]